MQSEGSKGWKERAGESCEGGGGGKNERRVRRYSKSRGVGRGR